ncbi:MAG: serine/threonine protein kinase [Anaerolineales bacterium]|nr:serine/threonine protein kinase [Anaerolineales bacterium]
MAKMLKDRYELIGELGKGGMGVVYRGRDTQLDREVAIKLLPPQLSQDPTFLQRFEREAKAVTSLEHNNIVPVYDFGQDRNQTFLIMRLLKGGDLKKKIENNPLSVPETIRVLRQVGSALDKAHANNIIHRDLKPGNILFDDDGNAFLGDFGIVKLTNESKSFTQTGGTLGTPYYMSPEQIREPQTIDHRADLYSLGVILYEMLTGNLPYDSESSFDLQNMHVNNPIPSLLANNSELPQALDDVIQKAMAKKREDRYDSAKALVNDLEVAATAPAVAVAPPAPEPEPEPEPEPVAAAPVPEPEPEPEPAPEPTPEPAPVVAKAAPAPAPASSSAPAAAPTTAPPQGGIPKWAYALGGIVIILIVFGIIAALGSGGDTPTVSATATVEEAIIEAGSTEEPAAEPTAASSEPEVVPINGEIQSEEPFCFDDENIGGRSVDIIVFPDQADFDPVIFIMNEAGDILDEQDANGDGGEEELLNFVVPDDNVHFICIAGFEGSLGSFNGEIVTR